ncbi:MAG: T9SS type A sorting domain-containing protein [Bacteroidetes bacterium]|nr:T9SS type A sorting domain-containing protein [Bacteroidota bacterium]
MKNILTLAIISLSVIASFSAKSQNLGYVEGKHLSVQIPLTGYPEVYSHFYNMSGKSLNLRWKRISNTLINSWDYSICDNGNCFAGIPDSGSNTTMKAGDTAFFKLLVDTKGVKGKGTVVIQVIQTTSAGVREDTMSIAVETETTGINYTVSKTDNIKLYPNPVKESLQIMNYGNTKVISVYNLSGQQVVKSNMSLTGISYINVTSLASGLYIVKTVDAKGNTGYEKFIKE